MAKPHMLSFSSERNVTINVTMISQASDKKQQMKSKREKIGLSGVGALPLSLACRTKGSL